MEPLASVSGLNSLLSQPGLLIIWATVRGRLGQGWQFAGWCWIRRKFMWCQYTWRKKSAYALKRICSLSLQWIPVFVTHISDTGAAPAALEPELSPAKEISARAASRGTASICFRCYPFYHHSFSQNKVMATYSTQKSILTQFNRTIQNIISTSTSKWRLILSIPIMWTMSILESHQDYSTCKSVEATLTLIQKRFVIEHFTLETLVPPSAWNCPEPMTFIKT